MRRRLIPILLLISVLALGCQSLTPVETVKGLSERAPSMGSARMLMTMTMSFSFPAGTMGSAQAPPPSEFSFTVEGLTDFRRELGSMQMKMASGAQTGLTLPEIRTLYSGDFIYYEVPPAASSAFGGKSWARISLAKMVQGGFDLSSPTPRPEIFFDRLKGVDAEDITTIGEESIRGTDTTHYRVALTWQDYLAALPPEMREQQLSTLETSGFEIDPMDVWIDEDGFARKLVFSAGNAERTLSIAMTMELYDFGVDVEVEIPGDDEVFTVEDPAALGGLFGVAQVPGVGSSP